MSRVAETGPGCRAYGAHSVEARFPLAHTGGY